jgi:DNA-binding protein YbaB
MTSEMHPQAAEALQQMQRFQSALEDQIDRANTESSTGTDEAKTVEVTVDGYRHLTGVHLEDGLLRLGAETVQQRINEAIQNAKAAATVASEAASQRLIESLDDITGSLIKVLDLK